MGNRVLICADSPSKAVTSGFAEVNRAFVGGLASRGWDVHCVGVHDPGNPHDLPASIWACINEEAAPVRLVEAAVAVEPDIIVLFSDIGICGQWADALRRALPPPFGVDGVPRIPVPILVYSPVDGGGMVPEMLDWVTRDWFGAGLQVVTYTEWGRGELQGAIDQAVAAGAVSLSRKLPPVAVLSHGMDTESFYPVDWREARKALGIYGSVGDSFLLLNANTNTPRKRIDLTIAAWAEFLAMCPDAREAGARLWLHMNPLGAWDVKALLKRECLRRGVARWERHLLVTAEDHRELRGVSRSTMSLIYGACNAGITTSGGEGWGLTAWEHAACGRPQIVLDYAAHGEIFPLGSAFKVEPKAYVTAPDTLQVHGIVDPHDVEACIFGLWKMWREKPESYHAIAEAGYNAATAVSWDAVAERLAGMLAGMLE